MVIKGLFTLTGTSLKRLKLHKILEVLHAGIVGVVFFSYIGLCSFWLVASSIVTHQQVNYGWMVPFMLEKLQAVENVRRCCLYMCCSNVKSVVLGLFIQL